MNTIGIHQPYFFPYIGYFQLINAVDVWVCLDHVSFMKRSYMTRNTLTRQGIEINIPVLGGSQNKTCKEVYADCTDRWFDKFSRTLDLQYKNEINYCEVMDEVLAPWYEQIRDFRDYRIKTDKGGISISEFNFTAIYHVCQYLDIETKFYGSSNTTEQKREKGLQDIVKHYNGTHYINAIGGQSLYSKEDFASQNIDLKFIKNTSELPNTSILDILFRYNKDVIIKELYNYTLI